MMEDAGARILFVDAAAAEVIGAGDAQAPFRASRSTARAPAATSRPGSRPPARGRRRSSCSRLALQHHLLVGHHRRAQGHRAAPRHALGPVQARREYGYGPDTVTLMSTPLYSNTTLVVFFPTLALGGSVVLMPKFDAAAFLKLAERHRVTHTMLVPVQYQRLMAQPDFDRSISRASASSSAPARRSPPRSRPTCCSAGPAG